MTCDYQYYRYRITVFFIIDLDRDLLSLDMLKIGTVLLLVGLVAASYNEALGEKLCRLTVASYCKKAEV